MKRPAIILLGAISVVIMAVAAAWLLSTLAEPAPYASKPARQRSRAEIVQACNAHVRQAVASANAVIDARATEFSLFVEGRKPGVRPFATELVSWYGKWRAVKSHLPFTAPDGHKQYVSDVFGRHVFTGADLSAAMMRVVTESSRDLEGIENKLAVAVRREIESGNATSLAPPATNQQLSGTVERLRSASQWDAAKAAGSLVTSEVVSIVGTKVLTRMGVSAGLLGAGAANSWWTLGAGMVLGVIADLVWDAIDDPAGDIERETLQALNQLADAGAGALREELRGALNKRSKFWNKTIEESLP